LVKKGKAFCTLKVASVGGNIGTGAPILPSPHIPVDCENHVRKCSVINLVPFIFTPVAPIVMVITGLAKTISEGPTVIELTPPALNVMVPLLSVSESAAFANITSVAFWVMVVAPAEAELTISPLFKVTLSRELLNVIVPPGVELFSKTTEVVLVDWYVFVSSILFPVGESDILKSCNDKLAVLSRFNCMWGSRALVADCIEKVFVV